MDQAVVEAFKAAGLDTDLQRRLPLLAIAVDERDEPQPVDEEVAIMTAGEPLWVRLGEISELWTGDVEPPPFLRTPPPAYVMFFAMIERTAADYCASTKHFVKDTEFERLYDLLRRRPDGSDANPIFSYLQAAVRLYMSLRDVSRREFEAVARRLSQSARTFSEGYTSVNYYEHALSPLLGIGP